jgi:hypothetical protein
MIIEDINVYLNYFGEPAVYHETAELSHTIKAIFNREENFEGERVTYDIKVTVKSTDVPAYAVNKRFEIRGVNYYIKNWERDKINDDILILELSKAAV